MNLYQIVMFVVLACSVVTACKPKVTVQPLQESCATPPAGVRFVVVDKAGKPLINTVKDIIRITYEKNNQVKEVDCTIFTLQESAADTNKTDKFNGLAIYSLDMCWLSSEENEPIKSFDLTINQVYIGRLFYDFQKVPWTKENGCYEQKSFKLDDKASIVDKSVFPYVAVLHQ